MKCVTEIKSCVTSTLSNAISLEFESSWNKQQTKERGNVFTVFQLKCTSSFSSKTWIGTKSHLKSKINSLWRGLRLQKLCIYEINQWPFYQVDLLKKWTWRLEEIPYAGKEFNRVHAVHLNNVGWYNRKMFQFLLWEALRICYEEERGKKLNNMPTNGAAFCSEKWRMKSKEVESVIHVSFHFFFE